MNETRAKKKEAILDFIKGETSKLMGFPIEWWIDTQKYSAIRKILKTWRILK